ncbi:MAG TPA: DUF4388 domain-containing protein [Deltaproteobacteria bacterium]|nr:DUF4388 domain-containing protein [Deltaproteobacteria bacterium]HPJ93223.1 DUF4388 domain-containing protein [Deltaproteobacteria bacterium]HPR52094.1 DUF4388 domain-containing protein [Deltaproteobacteria bacterium]
MALLGTLKGFGVTEIFQLISQQMKTGTLVLTSPKANVSIAFEDGVIVGIQSDQWTMDPRAEVLMKGGFIHEKQLKMAFDNEKKSNTWDDILISQGKLKKNFLDKATNVVIKDILLEIFQWKEGGYRFEDWDVNTENMLSCHIQSEGVILNTLRVIDEWPLIKQKIPPVDYCPVTIMPLTQEIVRKNDLSEVDMQVFDLIDELKTIENIVRESLEPPVEALSSIVKLISAGLVEVFPQGTKENRDSSIARKVFFGHIKRASVFVLLVLSVLGLILVGNPRITKGTFIPQEIKTYIQEQKDIADQFAKQEIWLSRLDTDSNARRRASSPE